MHLPRRGPTAADVAFDLVRTLFVASAITCALSALHRIASGIKLGARVQVLEQTGDAFTAEEREELVRRIKHRSLCGL